MSNFCCCSREELEPMPQECLPPSNKTDIVAKPKHENGSNNAAVPATPQTTNDNEKMEKKEKKPTKRKEPTVAPEPPEKIAPHPGGMKNVGKVGNFGNFGRDAEPKSTAIQSTFQPDTGRGGNSRAPPTEKQDDTHETGAGTQSIFHSTAMTLVEKFRRHKQKEKDNKMKGSSKKDVASASLAYNERVVDLTAIGGKKAERKFGASPPGAGSAFQDDFVSIGGCQTDGATTTYAASSFGTSTLPDPPPPKNKFKKIK